MESNNSTNQILVAEDKHEKDWEQFVESSACRHHCFRWPWRKIIQDVFGHKPYYLICYSQDTDENQTGPKTVSGVLPCFLVRSRLFGSALISVPYLNGGGILADSKEAHSALFDRASQIGSDLGVRYIEFRCRSETAWNPAGLEQRTHKAASILELRPSAEELFASFPAKLRSQIRRPTKSGAEAISVLGGECSPALIKRFYGVFSTNMRDLGTPVYPRALFEKVIDLFPNSSRLIGVELEGRLVAAGITLSNAVSVEIPWASSLKEFNSEAVNMLMYWEAIKQSCLAGSLYFDFGRSTIGSGTFRFKAQWGAQPIQLFWYYKLYEGELPNVSPKNPAFSTLVNCWRHLPIPVANLLGPWISRSLP